MNAASTFKRTALTTLAALALLLGLATRGRAQSAGTGSIDGTVTDPKGLAVSGASVTVINTATGAKRELVTNEFGLYAAIFLQSGTYEVHAKKEGFAEVIRGNVYLLVGQSITVDISLPLAAAAQQSVTVSAEAVRVETEKGDVSQTVYQAMVENLPLANRRWDNLVLLTPGVAEDGYFGLISFRGISGLYNNNMVDGADNNQAFFSEARGRTRLPYGYSMDAIKEFNVTTAAYSAQYGRAAGGVVNAITKSGTNTYHGDAYYFVRDAIWLARDPVANGFGRPKPDERRQFFGGGIGGPVLKDKLFFYANYDQFKRNFPAITTPNSANFFNPNASTKASGSQAANCLAGASAALAAECNTILTALQPQFLTTAPRTGNNYIGLAKMDYQLNANNRISGVFNILRWDSPNGIQTGPTINVSPLANGADDVHNQFVTATWNSVFSPTMVNEVRFQYGEDFEFEIPNAPPPSFPWSSSSIGGADFGMPNFLPRTFFPDEKRYQWVDDVSWVYGRHEFKTGFDINHVSDKFLNLFNGGGTYSYSGATALKSLAQDLINNSSATCTPPANFAGCSALFSSFSQAGDAIFGGAGSFSTNDYNFYIQDNFKWRPNFTINVGLRYELQAMPNVIQANPFVPDTGKLNTDTNNIGPRLGIAWDISGNQTQVVRGGYGIYYGRTQNSTILTFLFQNGVFQKSFNISPANIAKNFPAFFNTCVPLAPNLLFPAPSGSPPPAPIFGTAGPAPGTLFPSVNAFTTACGPVLRAGSVVDTLDPHFVNPLIHEFDLAYERQLPANFILTLSYLGSRGLHLPDFFDTNLPAPDTTATFLAFDTQGNPLPPFQFTVPFFSGAVPRPNPNVGPIEEGRSIVNSWYNALVVRFHRRETHGFSFDTSFTWSRSIDDGAVQGNFGTFTGTDSPLNPYNIKAEYGPSDLNIPKRFIGNFYWVTPFANWTQSDALKKLFGGWKFSGIVKAQDGIPVSANMSLPFSFSCPNGDGGITCGAISGNAGFVNGRAPFIERNSHFEVPGGFFTTDFRVDREFKIKEQTAIEFMVEAFNLFNRANIFGVQNTAFDQRPANFTMNSVTGVKCPAALAGHADYKGCVQADPGFLLPSSSSNTLYGARQLQMGLRFTF